MGFGVAAAIGRVGGMFMPWIVEGLRVFNAEFLGFGIWSFFCALTVYKGLTIETQGMQLDFL